MSWPYKNIDYADFVAAIKLAEQIIQKLGAEYVEECENCETWIWRNGESGLEEVQQKVFRYGDEFFRVDSVYFPEKPFIVLEFGDELFGPYEDADSFPFDLPEEEFEQEIRYSLGLEPYPE